MEVIIANKKVPAVINKGKTYIERAFDDENKTDGLSVKVTGFVKEEAPANLKDYKNPTVKEDMDKKSTDAPETYVDDYLYRMFWKQMLRATMNLTLTMQKDWDCILQRLKHPLMAEQCRLKTVKMYTKRQQIN